MEKYKIANYDIVFNKIDLEGLEPSIIRKSPTEIYLSAINNVGVDNIRDRIDLLVDEVIKYGKWDPVKLELIGYDKRY